MVFSVPSAARRSASRVFCTLPLSRRARSAASLAVWRLSLASPIWAGTFRSTGAWSLALAGYGCRAGPEVTVACRPDHRVTARAGGGGVPGGAPGTEVTTTKTSIQPRSPVTACHGTSFTPTHTTTGYALFRAGVKVSAGTCETLPQSVEGRNPEPG